jgi:hypothetical protein
MAHCCRLAIFRLTVCAECPQVARSEGFGAGIVTLTGNVSSYAEKIAAERIARIRNAIAPKDACNLRHGDLVIRNK